MTREAGAQMAEALAGMGGAPGVPGRTYVVAVPVDVMAMTARAAVLLSSADCILTDGPTDEPLFRMAGDVPVLQRRIGDPVKPGRGVVVRVVRQQPIHDVPGLVDELARLDRAGVAFEVEPVPTGPRVPTVVTAWTGRLALRGMRVLVPRTREQASGLSMHIRSLGGEPVEAPTIQVEPGDTDRLVRAVEQLAGGEFAAVCLTSPNGVAAFAEALDAAGLDARALAMVTTVACVGPGTAQALWDRLGVGADLVPEQATTAALAEAFPSGRGRVLLPRADIASAELPHGLVTKGYDPVEVVAYRTVRPAGLDEAVMDDLAAGRIQLLAFASSSTVRNFVELVGDEPWRGHVVSIGPVTTRTAVDLGLTVAAEADPHTIDGLVAALAEVARRLR
jgi:uroporphyrinogen-III synthase